MAESFSSLFHGRIFQQVDNKNLGGADSSFEGTSNSASISNASLVNSPCPMSVTHDKPLPRRTSKTIKRRLTSFYDNDASPLPAIVAPLPGLMAAEDTVGLGVVVLGDGDESSRDSGISVCSSAVDAAPPPRQQFPSLMDMDVEVECTWLKVENTQESLIDEASSGDFMRWLRCSSRPYHSHLSPLLDNENSPSTLPLPLTKRSSLLTVPAVDRRGRLSTCSTLSDTSSNGGSPTPVDSPTLSWLSKKHCDATVDVQGSKLGRFSVLDKENPPRRASSKLDHITRTAAFKPRNIVSEGTHAGPGVCSSLGEEEEGVTRCDMSPGVKDVQRCHSEAFIKHVLGEKDDEERVGGIGDLVGDKSTHHSLPLVQSMKHSDLKCISPDTMAAVLRNDYDDVIDRYTIVDCRYPYEYAGGHIEGAKNICSKEEILAEFFTLTKHQTTASSSTTQQHRRNIFIFHCEFSSERAPKLLRFLRNHDRHVHKDSYPSLHYPEIYLLEGGYKAFYETHARLCSPMSYTPMLHSDHTADLRHFRCKSKSSGESRTGRTCQFTRRKSLRM